MALENTFVLNLRSDAMLATNDPVPTLNSAPYSEFGAVLGIMNGHGSDTIVKIKSVKINELIGRSGTALTFMDIRRISAYAGGESVSIKKFNSSASLPVQVTAVINPGSVTTTESYLRRAITQTGLTPATALLGHYGLRGAVCGAGGLNLNHSYCCTDSDNQRYVLREGEGIAILSNKTAPANFPIEIIIHFSDGTNSYCINEDVDINATNEVCALINGSGSGVILYVDRIEWRHLKTVDLFKSLSFESCCEIYGGNTITPISMDSANAAINSLVQFKARCAVLQSTSGDVMKGRNAKFGNDVTPWRRLALPVFGIGVALASGLLRMDGASPTKCFDYNLVGGYGEIVLREGEGFCILQRTNFSGWGPHGINITFTIEDTSTPESGGESSYVF